MLNNDSIDFQPVVNAALSLGMVLRIGETNSQYLRITHIFKDCVYAMWVDEPKNARYARRPLRKSMSEIDLFAKDPSSTWGRFPLPSRMTSSSPEIVDQPELINSAWHLIEPLIVAFETEANLDRSRFTALIRERAETTEVSFIVLQRMVLRYYYFGRTRLGLLELQRGVKAGSHKQRSLEIATSNSKRPSKRRGRQAILTEELGPNDFIVDEDDIIDMVNSLKTCLRQRPTFKTTAYEEYLAGNFRRRHPEIYAEYIAGKRVEPVTLKQYRYYTDIHAHLDDALSKNLRTNQRNPGHLGSLTAAGPGEIYEIDSTGGRLYLISTDDSPILVGKPTIYLIIDRWSRFVVSVYISLRAPSYEEVRYALLVAFTSREKRFRALGVDINDERWPIGRMPAVICPDRGSDFMSDSMEQAVVQDLRIDLTPLPPLCPDGKAIVERLIRELKRRMSASGMKGVYAERPLDPESKKAARQAQNAAIHSLSEAYRALIEIIDDHNNRPHSALKRRRSLVQAGVQPTPKSAYLWGCKHISGLRMPPLSDDDYQRLLLSSDTANIAKGVLRYKSRPYLPTNEVAFDIAEKSTARAKQVPVRVDKSDPQEIFISRDGGDWARFHLTLGGATELAGLALDEEEAFANAGARLWARAEHQSRIKRVADKNVKVKSHGRKNIVVEKVDKLRQLDVRNHETDIVKRHLTGKPPIPRPSAAEKILSPSEEWIAVEEDERMRNLEIIRQQRRKT